MLSEKELFEKCKIEEEAFKVFLKNLKHLKKPPADENISMEDFGFWLGYRFISDLEVDNAYRGEKDWERYKDFWVAWPKIKMECWIGVWYRALLCVTKKGIRRTTWSSINFVITDKSARRKPNKPNKGLFYLRLSKEDYALIEEAVYESIRDCLKKTWMHRVKNKEMFENLCLKS